MTTEIKVFLVLIVVVGLWTFGLDYVSERLREQETCLKQSGIYIGDRCVVGREVNVRP